MYICTYVESCSQNQLSTIRIEITEDSDDDSGWPKLRRVASRPLFARFGTNLRFRWSSRRFEPHQSGSEFFEFEVSDVFSRVFCKALLNYQHFSQQRRYVAFLAFDHLFGEFLVCFLLLIWHDFRWTFGLKNPIPQPKAKLLRPQTSPVLTAPSEPFTLADVLTLSRSTGNFFRVRASSGEVSKVMGVLQTLHGLCSWKTRKLRL
jgi:hypothetical protein